MFFLLKKFFNKQSKLFSEVTSIVVGRWETLLYSISGCKNSKIIDLKINSDNGVFESKFRKLISGRLFLLRHEFNSLKYCNLIVLIINSIELLSLNFVLIKWANYFAF